MLASGSGETTTVTGRDDASEVEARARLSDMAAGRGAGEAGRAELSWPSSSLVGAREQRKNENCVTPVVGLPSPSQLQHHPHRR